MPTFGTSTVVETQFGALVPGAHKRADDAVNVTPLGVVSLVNKFTLWLAPTTPEVVFAIAAEAPGGVTVGVIDEELY